MHITWGVLGTASIARRRFVPGLKKAKKADIAAVASRDFEKAKKFAQDLDVPKAYGSYEELLADPDIQAVYIPLPNYMHAEWTTKAARAGKHVLCEKPLAPDPQSCRRMIDACRKAGVLLMEAFMYRLHPRTIRLKDLVDGGKIGDIRTIVAVNTHSKAIDIEHDARFYPQKGAGVLADVGVYCVNVSRYLYGSEPIAVTGKACFLESTGADLSFSGMLEFPGGGTALFDSSYQTSYRQYMEIGGTEGSVYLDRPFVPGDGSKTMDFSKQGSMDIEKIRIKGTDQFTLEIDAFSNAILKGLPAPLDPEDAVKNMVILEALMKSAKTGKRVTSDQ